MRRKLGRQGEEKAVEFLKKEGYKILDQNYYTHYGELDVICEKNREIIFVEVKTRRSNRFGATRRSDNLSQNGAYEACSSFYI